MILTSWTNASDNRTFNKKLTEANKNKIIKKYFVKKEPPFVVIVGVVVLVEEEEDMFSQPARKEKDARVCVVVVVVVVIVAWKAENPKPSEKNANCRKYVNYSTGIYCAYKL